MVCVLATLVETIAGLAFVSGADCVLLSGIVDAFSCRKELVGKPKLFFFLDDGTKKDSIPLTQVLVRRN